MEFQSKEYDLYKKINFCDRYESLSNSYQFEERLEYTNNEVIQMISELGFKSKYVKIDNFFKIEEKGERVKFYLNICLKYSNVELIIGATDSKSNKFITGSVFGRLFRNIKYAEGIDILENIKKPKFRNYKDLREILQEAFSIYEDFKKELLNNKIE